jgi:hypothetical protein
MVCDADFDNTGGEDGVINRVPEFQAHPASDVPDLQH